MSDHAAFAEITFVILMILLQVTYRQKKLPTEETDNPAQGAAGGGGGRETEEEDKRMLPTATIRQRMKDHMRQPASLEHSLE